MTTEELERRFTPHVASDGQSARMIKVRDSAMSLAIVIDSLVNDTREKALAMTNLEEAVFWAVAGIARE